MKTNPSKTIEIIISPAGQTRIETRGFRGEECRDASRFIERALGKRTAETLTGEYHGQAIEQSNHLQQGS